MLQANENFTSPSFSAPNPETPEAAAATVVGGTAAESWEPQHREDERTLPQPQCHSAIRHAVKGADAREKTQIEHDVAHCSKLRRGPVQ